MHQGPVPKQAIGLTMASKNFSLFLMEAFLLRKIPLLAKRARLADCKGESISRVACLEPAADNMQPFPFSLTLIMAPVEVVKTVVAGLVL